MGQRGNYIIKTKDGIDIYYTHWRANLIANDLLLGKRKFIDHIQQFEKRDELINEPWIEGCVLVDLTIKKLLFYEIEQLSEYSLREAYLAILKDKWPGWKIVYAEKEMYDIEKELSISYTKHQETNFNRIEIERLKNDEVSDYVACFIILKKDGQVALKKLYTGSDEEVALVGEQLIDILQNKPSSPLVKESEIEIWDILLIDRDQKQLYVNQSITGLNEALVDLWPNWKIEIGSFGYIKLLEVAGYDTTELRMNQTEIDEHIKSILNYKDDFDPIKTAEKILENHQDVKFHPSFFENIKPKKTLLDKIKSIFKKK
ncbi:hypothetical protein [Aquimarina rubra]|uniref:T4 RNA ligase 1-like N-terminal domain-containing protein n=1 Tax=Aquimarina rubra TaxID=1920033 RepID=A0ABW5LBX3_9FLAO